MLGELHKMVSKPEVLESFGQSFLLWKGRFFAEVGIDVGVGPLMRLILIRG